MRSKRRSSFRPKYCCFLYFEISYWYFQSFGRQITFTICGVQAKYAWICIYEIFYGSPKTLGWGIIFEIPWRFSHRRFFDGNSRKDLRLNASWRRFFFQTEWSKTKSRRTVYPLWASVRRIKTNRLKNFEKKWNHWINARQFTLTAPLRVRRNCLIICKQITLHRRHCLQGPGWVDFRYDFFKINSLFRGTFPLCINGTLYMLIY